MDSSSGYPEYDYGLNSSMRRNEIVLRKKHEKLNNSVAKTQAKYAGFVTYEVLPRILFCF